MKSPGPHNCCFPLGMVPAVCSQGGLEQSATAAGQMDNRTILGNGLPIIYQRWGCPLTLSQKPGSFICIFLVPLTFHIYEVVLLTNFISEKIFKHHIFILFSTPCPHPVHFTLFHGDWLILFTLLFFKPGHFCRPPGHSHSVVLLLHFFVTRMY